MDQKLQGEVEESQGAEEKRGDSQTLPLLEEGDQNQRGNDGDHRLLCQEPQQAEEQGRSEREPVRPLQETQKPLERQEVKGRPQGDLTSGEPHHRTVAHRVDAEEESGEKGQTLAPAQGGDDQEEEKGVHPVQQKAAEVGRVGIRKEPELDEVEEVGQGFEEVADREGEDVADLRRGASRLDPPDEVVGVVADPEGAPVDSEGQRHQKQEKHRFPLLQLLPQPKEGGEGPVGAVREEESPQGQETEADQ